ncbi:MAG TPA: HEAT repeat domain-containing protein [Phototrophicaceae bacterium]|nr:HEAT repeat domain-containing protein [Phototrophicaceae bacterium]
MDYDQKRPDLNTTLSALSDGEVTSTLYYGLSGLDPSDVRRLAPVWEKLEPSFRRKLLQELVDASEANFELDYNVLGQFALRDNDAAVREAAIELLWEDESLPLMHRLTDMALQDESVPVRAAAVSALGRFILLGELGDLPESETTIAQDTAVHILHNQREDIDVRRRALEAIANCGHEIVDEAIREGYDGPDRRMQISSVFAMGRTYDEQWNEFVLAQLESDDPEMRYEATRAAGELEIEEAVPTLTRLALDDDREVKEVAIWSLGEIGSKEAVRVLESLANEAKRLNDDELNDAIEDALGTASLGSGSLMLMRFDDPETDD